MDYDTYSVKIHQFLNEKFDQFSIEFTLFLSIFTNKASPAAF